MLSANDTDNARSVPYAFFSKPEEVHCIEEWLGIVAIRGDTKASFHMSPYLKMLEASDDADLSSQTALEAHISFEESSDQ
jgi:hypothetical protein